MLGRFCQLAQKPVFLIWVAGSVIGTTARRPSLTTIGLELPEVRPSIFART